VDMNLRYFPVTRDANIAAIAGFGMARRKLTYVQALASNGTWADAVCLSLEERQTWQTFD
jgi:hypothetical protein